jgi:Fe-S-cluster containining protein
VPTTDHRQDHDPDGCYECLSRLEVTCGCRCAECCRSLIVEAGIEDAEREPLIRVRGSAIYAPAELAVSENEELEGYLLNGPNGACVFLDQESNLCTIYATRPLVCRHFDCDGEGREQLVELGIIEHDK